MMIVIECITTRPGINRFTPGKRYAGHPDADGQAIHTIDDTGNEVFIFFVASSQGTFREINERFNNLND